MIRNMMMRHEKSRSRGEKEIRGGLIEVEIISVHVYVKQERANEGQRGMKGEQRGGLVINT